MITKTRCFENYRNKLEIKGIEFRQLNTTMNDVERMVALFIEIDSEYLFPTNDIKKLTMYSKKLIDNAYNFILVDKGRDIGIISIYANDYKTKTSFTSTIGISPSFRGGFIAKYLVDFGIGFSKEKGMETYKAEINKNNEKWLTFLTKHKFKIESETEDNSYIITRDLKID